MSGVRIGQTYARGDGTPASGTVAMTVFPPGGPAGGTQTAVLDAQGAMVLAWPVDPAAPTRYRVDESIDGLAGQWWAWVRPDMERQSVNLSALAPSSGLAADPSTGLHRHSDLAAAARVNRTFLWRGTVPGDPGPGGIIVDSTGGQSRVLHLSKTDSEGGAIDLRIMMPGDNLTITDDPATPPITGFARYVATGDPVDAGTFWTVAATRTDTSGTQAAPPAGTPVRVLLTTTGGSGSALYLPLAGGTMDTGSDIVLGLAAPPLPRSAAPRSWVQDGLDAKSDVDHVHSAAATWFSDQVWSDTTDPAAVPLLDGELATDTAFFTTTSVVLVSKNDQSGSPTVDWWAGVAMGDRIVIVDAALTGQLDSVVNGAVRDLGAWVEVPVAPLSASTATNPADGSHATLMWIPPRQADTYVKRAGDEMSGDLSFRDDGDGVRFLTGTPGASGGRVYKKFGTGVTITQDSTNLQPAIENADGTNRRAIIDTTNGDARYALKSEAVGDKVLMSKTMGITAGRWYRVASVALDGSVEIALHAATVDGLNGFGADLTAWLRHTSVAYSQFDIKDVSVFGTKLFDRVGIWSAYYVWVRAAATNPSVIVGVQAARVSHGASGISDLLEATTPGGTTYGEAALNVTAYLPLAGGTMTGKLFANDGLKVGNALEIQDGTTSSCTLPGTWNVPASGTTRTVKINSAGTLMAEGSTWRIKRSIGGIDGGPAPAAVPMERRSVPQAGAHPAGVLDLTPVVFTDESGHRKAGLIAEDVGDHFPIATSPDMDHVDWSAITAGLLHEVQRLSSRVAALEEGS